MRYLTLLLLIMGCSGAAPPDVTGPYTGQMYRFAVDAIDMPANRTVFADDLNGDHEIDNQLGNLYEALLAGEDEDAHAADQIASGAIASFVEITSDDPTLQNDPTVSVRFLGYDGAPAAPVGGRLEDGRFVSNRSRWTRVPGAAVVSLPLAADADPVATTLEGVEVEFEPDANGLVARVHGVIRAEEALPLAYTPIVQMIDFDARAHLQLASLLDANADGRITMQELAAAAIMKNLLAPDVEMFNPVGAYRPDPGNAHKNALSVGFQAHLVPCANGACARRVPADPCHDRVRDGDESDVDCGGGCAPCAAGRACFSDGDCQPGLVCSGALGFTGACANPAG